MIPDWPPGTATVLVTHGEEPHAIPVSTAVRRGDTTVMLALGRRRTSLARLEADPRVALVVMAGDNVAVTLHGRAFAAGEAAGTVAVRVEVDRVQDHMTPDFAIDAGVDWRWTDPQAAERDRQVRDAL